MGSFNREEPLEVIFDSEKLKFNQEVVSAIALNFHHLLELNISTPIWEIDQLGLGVREVSLLGKSLPYLRKLDSSNSDVK